MCDDDSGVSAVKRESAELEGRGGKKERGTASASGVRHLQWLLGRRLREEVPARHREKMRSGVRTYMGGGVVLAVRSSTNAPALIHALSTVN